MSRFGNLELNNEFEEPLCQQGIVKDEGYYFNEARSAFERGLFERALRGYAKVLEFNSQKAEAWTGQVQALIELGEFREAKLWADKALERFPREPELLAAKAVALARIGDLNGALAFSDASIEERGDTPYVWIARGDVLLARNEKPADYCMDKALLLAPLSWFYRWLVSRVYYYHQQFAKALKIAQQALQHDADRAVIWWQVGLCQIEIGLQAAARLSLEQAAQLDPLLDDVPRALDRVAHTSFIKRISNRCRNLFSS